MTKKDFFVLSIKLFGLSSALSAVFYTLPSNLGNLLYAFQDLDWALIILILIILIVTVGLFLVLIFKAHKVVEILKLDKGFNDDRIELGNFKSEDLIKIGSFIIGGLMIIKNIPLALNYLLVSFKGEINGIEFTSKDKFNWIVTGTNLLIGYLFLTNYDLVAKLLRPKKEN